MRGTFKNYDVVIHHNNEADFEAILYRHVDSGHTYNYKEHATSYALLRIEILKEHNVDIYSIKFTVEELKEDVKKKEEQV